MRSFKREAGPSESPNAGTPPHEQRPALPRLVHQQRQPPPRLCSGRFPLARADRQCRFPSAIGPLGVGDPRGLEFPLIMRLPRRSSNSRNAEPEHQSLEEDPELAPPVEMEVTIEIGAGAKGLRVLPKRACIIERIPGRPNIRDLEACCPEAFDSHAADRTTDHRPR